MSTEAWWWLTLGLGLVVAIVAVVLLHIFYRLVRRIERGADAVWETGKQVARNTATTWMLQQTTVRLDGLTEEAVAHDAFLDAAAGETGAAGEAEVPSADEGSTEEPAR